VRRVQRPTDNAADVFRTCISRVRNRDLKRRLTSVVAEIETAANAFETAADTSSYYALQPQNSVNGIITGSEMVDVYEQRMVPNTAPGRPIYERLLAEPAHGRCPLCGQRDVSTLDHYLPKSDFPALAVVPINLVPSCKDCNHAKQGRPNTAEEQTLHPYFDDVENDLWLSAEVYCCAFKSVLTRMGQSGISRKPDCPGIG
jgi:5-methylcytosine-specific restriction endonuclease McrA